MLPTRVKVTKNRFGEIESIFTEAKNNQLKTNAGKKIYNDK